MSHSIEMLSAGVLDFRILHRFGRLNKGAYDFFGLDEATLRLGFDYGISKKFTIGIGRGSHKKEFDGFIKYMMLQQSTGLKPVPVSIVIVTGTTLQTLKWNDAVDHVFSDRLSFYFQLIIGRKFTDAFTLQIMPTIVHRNFVENEGENNTIFAAGIGSRIRLNRTFSLTADYYYVVLDLNSNLHNPLSIGIDIEKGGHVFQLHFTNAIGMNERVFLAETFNDWAKGDIQFGFNISRVFQIGKR